MIRCKEGVWFDYLRPEIYSLFPMLEKVFAEQGVDCVITCGCEAHPPSDPHSHGYAVDLRTNHLAAPQAQVVFTCLRQQLDPTYTVLFEDPQGANQHIHLQVRKDIWPTLIGA
jgi:hypothetical protein